MTAHVHRTTGRRSRLGLVLGAVMVFATLLTGPLAGLAPAVQAQGTQTFTTCVANGAPPTITLPANTTVRFRVEGREHPETAPFQSGGAATVALRLPHEAVPPLPGRP